MDVVKNQTATLDDKEIREAIAFYASRMFGGETEYDPDTVKINFKAGDQIFAATVESEG